MIHHLWSVFLWMSIVIFAALVLLLTVGLVVDVVVAQRWKKKWDAELDEHMKKLGDE